MSASKKRSSSSSSSKGQTKRAKFTEDTKKTDANEKDEASKSLATMSGWQIEEEISENMIPVVGRMYRRENVVLTLFNHSLANLSAMELIKLHSSVRDHRNRPIKITDTWQNIRLRF